MVDDQEKALQFYTNVLGFVKKMDTPAGGARWLTVVSPNAPEGTELLLEPMGFDFARTFQKSLFDAGIPATMFGVKDIQKDYERMRAAGAVFRSAPAAMGPVIIADFEDTCGNIIRMAQMIQ